LLIQVMLEDRLNALVGAGAKVKGAAAGRFQTGVAGAFAHAHNAHHRPVIRSRITYSALLPRLAPETVEQFILDQLDRAGLGHNTFTAEALALTVRSGEGLLRRTRNLCLGSLIEAVRDQTRIVDLKQVNRVLIQPHWRKDCDQPIA
jgi:hypothetical protein